MTVGAPNLREVNCQVKSLSDIFISFLCQLNKLESVQWNWSPSSWVHGAPLAVRLHLAVNSDSSWPVRHISLADICTEKKTNCDAFLFLVRLSFHFPPLSVSNCGRLPLSPMYDLSWAAWSDNKSSVFIQSNPLRWQYSFSFLGGERILYLALPVKERQESCGGGGLYS